jgi:hypothetical protein
MEHDELNNWRKLAAELEASGETESKFYERAKMIALGYPDPLTLGDSNDSTLDEAQEPFEQLKTSKTLPR